ncbi:MAG TPA: NAD(P)-dependent alcohol dehydrogenase [Thermoanaerobaculia bacterium]|nr:NAD(P)-dependent alcohol dehydrogenase [Thermoanaerobaculia bacterium]
MRAAAYYEYGGPEVVKVAQLPAPLPKPGEIVVRVIAAGVNPKDAWIRSGAYRLFSGKRFPQITGSDFCGVITHPHQAAGKTVFGYLQHMHGGAAAELLAVPEAWTAIVPEGLDTNVAAALPCAYLAALQSLRDRGRIRPGSRVLIYGASGGVGTAATQLAKHFGAHVTAVSRWKNRGYCRENGAHEFIAYDKTGDVFAAREGYDIIFQVYMLEKHLYKRARKRLAERGVFVDLAGNPVLNFYSTIRRYQGVRTRFSHITRSKRDDLDLLARLAVERVIDPHVEVLPLEKAAEAHARMQTTHTRGKIVLRVT